MDKMDFGKTCSLCDHFETIHEQTIGDLFEFLMDYFEIMGMEELCIVSDEENTKELLYYAINGEYEIGMIELNSYEYDGPYIMTIGRNEDDFYNFEVTVEKARIDDKYLACGGKTFVQYDLPEKCDYINDVVRNKYITPDLALFEIGEVTDEDEYDSEDELFKYTYANEYRDDGVVAQIFVASNLKDYVDSAKADFENIFIDEE